MINAPNLYAGSTVGIVAPGRKMNQADVETAAALITGWGVNVVLASHLFSNSHSYLAGNDHERLEDFQSMVDNKNINAIICARGGYGSTRIVDSINFDALKNNPKWIVGFSDITAIHLKLFSLGYQSIHSTMPILFSNLESLSSVESLHKILFGGNVSISAYPDNNNKLGIATGETIGGNLSLIVDALGTSSAPNMNGKILIIEEVDEYLYRIDRMMIQLKRAGKLDNLAGLVVGHFTNIKDTELSFGEKLEQIILRVVGEYNFPVAFNFPIGHDNPNLAWKQGAIAKLEVNENGSSLNSL